MEAEEQVADDVVQADRVPELAAVVVALCDAGSVGGMVSEAAWHYKQVSKKPLKELRGAASKQGGSQFAGGSVDATTEREETPMKRRVGKRSKQGRGSERAKKDWKDPSKKKGGKMFMHSWKSVETSFLSLPPSPHLQSFTSFASYLLLATSFFPHIPVVSALNPPFILP